MKNVRQLISDRVLEALVKMMGPQGRDIDPIVRPSQDEHFGDYQSNCAMGLAKKLGQKPGDVAQDIIENLKIDDVCDPPKIAGPGFINFKLKNNFLAGALSAIPQPSADDEDRLGIERTDHPEVIAIDMSSPNLAKEMHVGHLRPTVIGDCVARILEFQGHQVHRINHVGDWGTQFGMLIQFIDEDARESGDVGPVMPGQKRSLINDLRIDDLEEYYVEAKKRFDNDPKFADGARQVVVDLQSGDASAWGIWKVFCEESLRHCHEIYEILGIDGLEDCGESFYNDMLPGIVQELREEGLAVEDKGAICVFPEGFTSRDGSPLPLMIQKSDGGYMYATTDLAALKYRIQTLEAKRIIYVVGSSQKLHFEMLFSVLAKTGWAGKEIQAVHIPTGILLKADGTPFKTREGGTVKLRELLDEAVERSRSFLQANEQDPEKRRGYSPAQIDEMARVIGLAAVKYYELSHNPTNDYRFDWETMLSLEGNTAPYMLYSYARIQSIARKAAGFSPRGSRGSREEADSIIIQHPSEAGLAKQLLRFSETIEQLGRDLRPNSLTEYLYDLSRAFSTFYDRITGVRVIDAEPAEVRLSRLRLCDLTGRTLKLGLGLLGIKTLERM